jgi:hypothetical protein
MNKQQLIASATQKYYAQLQREHEYRQRVRAGLIENVAIYSLYYL